MQWKPFNQGEVGWGCGTCKSVEGVVISLIETTPPCHCFRRTKCMPLVAASCITCTYAVTCGAISFVWNVNSA